MIDLHTHSTASDGSFTPTALMQEAALRGLSAIALTDHDTIEGLAAAKAKARELGLRFINGVEICVTWEPGEFHLLGLGFETPSPSLLAILETLRGARTERNLQMLNLMREDGIQANLGDIERFSEGQVVGRPHFAAFLVDRKIVKNREQAFDRYLAKGRPFYQPKAGVDLDEAIAAIHESGGVAIIAHPLSLYLSWGKLPDAIADFRAHRLDGLEAWHPGAKKNACKRLETLGRSLGMLVTAGSDFHGAARPERRLGLTAGDLKIDDQYLTGIPDSL